MPVNSPDFDGKAPPDKGASSFIYPPSPANLRFFTGILAGGGLVAIPTETVYGLAGLALSEEACRRIFSVKGRPLMDPLIVHVSGPDMAASLAEIPPEFPILSEAFWPGPLTLILRKLPVVPDIVTAGRPTVALRMPSHPVTRKLLHLLRAPLAAPSANPFGYISPTRPEHVTDSFGTRIPYVLDGGPCEIGLESTILDISRPGTRVLLRPGAISAGQIADVVGGPVECSSRITEEGAPAPAPGTMARHYSPSTRLSLFESPHVPAAGSESAVLLIQRPPSASVPANWYWLSERGELEEVAQSLFTMLRNLDRMGYQAIHCELPKADQSGLGGAIRDRLSRAAAR